MKFILALIFVIPTFGASLVVLFAYMYFSHIRFLQNFEKAIEYLSTDSFPLGTSFKEISYAQVLGYAHESAKITLMSGAYIQFNIKIADSEYAVTLDRSPNSNCAVLTAENIDWIRNAFIWLRKYMRVTSVSKIPELTHLQLGSVTCQEFYPCDIKEIPKDICKMKNLEQILLQFNKLEKLPAEIGQLSQLKDFKLGGNNLTSLPPEVGELTNLKILTIWKNSLTHIPKEIGQLTNLEGLSLWGNPLAELPDEITKLNKLKRLELGLMPNLKLTKKQKEWIIELEKNSCDIWCDDDLCDA